MKTTVLLGNGLVADGGYYVRSCAARTSFAQCAPEPAPGARGVSEDKGRGVSRKHKRRLPQAREKAIARAEAIARQHASPVQMTGAQ
jgi:hypothetical protein